MSGRADIAGACEDGLNALDIMVALREAGKLTEADLTSAIEDLRRTFERIEYMAGGPVVGGRLIPLLTMDELVAQVREQDVIARRQSMRLVNGGAA